MLNCVIGSSETPVPRKHRAQKWHTPCAMPEALAGSRAVVSKPFDRASAWSAATLVSCSPLEHSPGYKHHNRTREDPYEPYFLRERRQCHARPAKPQSDEHKNERLLQPFGHQKPRRNRRAPHGSLRGCFPFTVSPRSTSRQGLTKVPNVLSYRRLGGIAMRRRAFIAGLGSAAAWPMVAGRSRESGLLGLATSLSHLPPKMHASAPHFERAFETSATSKA
jgi:hypothetical protein